MSCEREVVWYLCERYDVVLEVKRKTVSMFQGGFVWGGLGKKIAEKSEVCCGGLNR